MIAARIFGGPQDGKEFLFPSAPPSVVRIPREPEVSLGTGFREVLYDEYTTRHLSDGRVLLVSPTIKI